jgi:hypothetical protein
MIIVHADTEAKAQELNDYVNSGKDVFMLIYMIGCGPCNATRPEWSKLENALEHQYKDNNNLVIASVESKVVSSVKHTGDIIGYPTLMYLSHNGKKIEHFESSSIKTKKRNVDCFMNWVESHVGNVKSISHNFKRVNKSRKYHYQYTNKQSRHKRRQSRYKQNKNKYRNNRVSKNRH